MKHFPKLLPLLLLLCACSSNDPDVEQAAPEEFILTIRESGDAKGLNPLTSGGVLTHYISNHVFQTLLEMDYKSLNITAVLAVARPQIDNKDSSVLITYDLKPEARWDNGESITSKDIAFSLKVIKCKAVNAHGLRSYFEFIEDIIYYEDEPKKFSLVCSSLYMRTEINSGGYTILPAYIYDSAGVLENFTIRELDEMDEVTDEALLSFAEHFNSEKFQREVLVGSGAYFFDRWETNQRIVVKKKPDWWGDQLKEVNHFFEANPKEIIYEIIPDKTTALTALLDLQIDVMRDIPAKDFIEDLPTNDKYKLHFRSLSPKKLYFDIIGFNTRIPLLADRDTRRALALLIPIKRIKEQVNKGLAGPALNYVHPNWKDIYNNDITPLKMDVDKASQMLAKAGWKDSDGNGVLDKNVDGKQIELEFTIMYSASKPIREQIALVIQDAVRKAGIKITPTPMERSSLINAIKTRNFELVVMGMRSPNIEPDPEQRSGDRSRIRYLHGFYRHNVSQLNKCCVQKYRQEGSGLYGSE